MLFNAIKMGAHGLEPRTSAMSTRRSNHLSYAPKVSALYQSIRILQDDWGWCHGFCKVNEAAASRRKKVMTGSSGYEAGDDPPGVLSKRGKPSSGCAA
jgi:hypothetical protein